MIRRHSWNASVSYCFQDQGIIVSIRGRDRDLVVSVRIIFDCIYFLYNLYYNFVILQYKNKNKKCNYVILKFN